MVLTEGDGRIGAIGTSAFVISFISRSCWLRVLFGFFLFEAMSPIVFFPTGAGVGESKWWEGEWRTALVNGGVARTANGARV